MSISWRSSDANTALTRAQRQALTIANGETRWVLGTDGFVYEVTQSNVSTGGGRITTSGDTQIELTTTPLSVPSESIAYIPAAGQTAARVFFNASGNELTGITTTNVVGLTELTGGSSDVNLPIAISDVTNLQSQLDGKINTSDISTSIPNTGAVDTRVASEQAVDEVRDSLATAIENRASLSGNTLTQQGESDVTVAVESVDVSGPLSLSSANELSISLPSVSNTHSAYRASPVSSDNFANDNESHIRTLDGVRYCPRRNADGSPVRIKVPGQDSGGLTGTFGTQGSGLNLSRTMVLTNLPAILTGTQTGFFNWNNIPNGELIDIIAAHASTNRVFVVSKLNNTTVTVFQAFDRLTRLPIDLTTITDSTAFNLTNASFSRLTTIDRIIAGRELPTSETLDAGDILRLGSDGLWDSVALPDSMGTTTIPINNLVAGDQVFQPSQQIAFRHSPTSDAADNFYTLVTNIATTAQTLSISGADNAAREVSFRDGIAANGSLVPSSRFELNPVDGFVIDATGRLSADRRSIRTRWDARIDYSPDDTTFIRDTSGVERAFFRSTAPAANTNRGILPIRADSVTDTLISSMAPVWSSGTDYEPYRFVVTSGTLYQANNGDTRVNTQPPSNTNGWTSVTLRSSSNPWQPVVLAQLDTGQIDDRIALADLDDLSDVPTPTQADIDADRVLKVTGGTPAAPVYQWQDDNTGTGMGSDNLITREVQTITASGTMTSASTAADERIIFSIPSTYTTSTGGTANRFSATWNWFGGAVTAAFDTFSIFAGDDQLLLSSVPNTGTADTSGIMVGDTLTFVVNGTTTTRTIEAVSDVAGSGTNAVGRLITFSGTDIARDFASFNDQTTVTVSTSTPATTFTVALIGGDYSAITNNPSIGPVSNSNVSIVNGQTAQAFLDRVRAQLITHYGSAGLTVDTSHTPAANTASIAVLTGASSTVASGAFTVSDTANEMVREETIAGVAVGSTYTIVFEPTTGSSILSGQFVLTNMTRAQVVAALSNHINSQTGWTATNDGIVITAVSDATTDQLGRWEITVDNGGGAGDVAFTPTVITQDGGFNVYGFGDGLTVGADGVVDASGPFASSTILGSPDIDHSFLLATATPGVFEWSPQPHQRVDIHNLIGVDINEVAEPGVAADNALPGFTFTVFNSLATQSVTGQVMISTGGPAYRFIRFGVANGTFAGYAVDQTVHLNIGTSTNLPFHITNNTTRGDGLSGNARQIVATFQGTDAEWEAVLTTVRGITVTTVTGSPALTGPLVNNMFQTANQIVFFIDANDLTIQRTVPGTTTGLLGRTSGQSLYDRLQGSTLNDAVEDGTWDPRKIDPSSGHAGDVVTRLIDGTTGWQRPNPNVHDVDGIDLGNDQVPATAGTWALDTANRNFSALDISQANNGNSAIHTGGGTGSNTGRYFSGFITKASATPEVGNRIQLVVGSTTGAGLDNRTVDLIVTNVFSLNNLLWDIRADFRGDDADWAAFLAEVRNTTNVPLADRTESSAYGLIVFRGSHFTITEPTATSSRGRLLQVDPTNGGISTVAAGGTIGAGTSLPTTATDGEVFVLTQTENTTRLVMITSGVNPITYTLGGTGTLQAAAASALPGSNYPAGGAPIPFRTATINLNEENTTPALRNAAGTLATAPAAAPNIQGSIGAYSARNNSGAWTSDLPAVDNDPVMFWLDGTTFRPLFIGADNGNNDTSFFFNPAAGQNGVLPTGTAPFNVYTYEPVTNAAGMYIRLAGVWRLVTLA